MTETAGQAGPRLAARAARAFAWSYGLTIVKSTLAFALSLVLARELGPGPFGLVAASLLVVGPGMLLVEAGAGAALIQRSHLTDATIACALAWQLTSGLALTVITFFAAPSLSGVLHSPQLAPVLRIMSAAFLLQSTGLVANALLRRSLRHRDILLCTLACYALTYGVIAIPLALDGFGVWALVAAQLLQAASSSACFIWLARHSWKLRWPWRDRPLLRFSNQVLQVNILNWMIENGDNFLVGRFFGATSLGLYGRAYTSLRLPADSLTSALQSVSFASHSRQQELLPGQTAYLATMNVITVLATPIFVTTAFLGPTLIEGLYGKPWLGAGGLVTPLSIAMIFHCFVAVSGPVLWARDRVRTEFQGQLLSLLILGAMLTIAVILHSLTLIAWAVAVAYGIRATLMSLATARVLDISAARMARVCVSGVRPAMAAALAVALIQSLSLSSLSDLLLSVTVAGLATTAIVSFAGRLEWTPELASLVASLNVPVVSSRVRRLRIHPQRS